MGTLLMALNTLHVIEQRLLREIPADLPLLDLVAATKERLELALSSEEIYAE